MECPYCGADSRVLDSRPSGDDIRRRRECLSCGRRFTTYERIAPPEIRVTKRGGRAAEDFDRMKLLDVVLKVTRGRPVTRKSCEDLVRGLEAELVDAGVETIASWQLAERLLARLRVLDGLAATRFATNYTEDDGSLRLAAEAPSPQLALPIAAAPAVTANAPPARRRPRRPGR